MEFENIIEYPLNFTTAFKSLPNKGNLVYEYNPFRNYRLTKPMFEYNGSLYTQKELQDEFGLICYVDETGIIATIDNILSEEKIRWEKNTITIDVGEFPILRREGELVDFETNELNFDLNHPVNIVPLYSYDGSVNLIINDGKNLPRLINSRFSATERNQYQIIDRKGDNDTNIYDLGYEFDIDTSLIKKTKSIPKLTFNNIFHNGNLPIGNYHFYFKYLDADGNESDFICESGLVSLFVGNAPMNIHTGIRDENSYKGISFSLDNLDSGYLYLSVYYTRASGDIYQNSTVLAYKINQKYLINSLNSCLIKISGYEDITLIPETDINLTYLIFSNVETLALCQNMLFFGNIEEQDLDYKELSDISLRFLPYYNIDKKYDVRAKISEEYNTQADFINSYYDTKYIYNSVGYWPGELYRFGIVYIMNDGSLSPVFSVRGINELPNIANISKYSSINFYNDDDRNYITYNEENNLIISDNGVSTILENCKGVVRFPKEEYNDNLEYYIYGLGFTLEKDLQNLIIEQLNKLGVRGYFFVRQRRMPTTLCQAFTIGVDRESYTPLIPYNDTYIAELLLSESYPQLDHRYDKRLREISPLNVNKGAICPDYDVDPAYYNQIFSGDEFTISKIRNIKLKRLYWNYRFYYEDGLDRQENIIGRQVNIQAVEDNQPLAAIDETFFRAKAGDASELIIFEWAEIENKSTEATNLIRGSFGPYLGLLNCEFEHSLINIYIPGYSEFNMSDYYTMRYNDKSQFYAIGDRINLYDYDPQKIFYRGDCYICQFTHRVNRNFQDPAAPTNDKIVDESSWDKYWEYKDGSLNTENLDKINLGDINAIQLGQWITFTLRSTKNLNIRTLDSSNVDEVSLTGISRGFYPYYPASTKGVYKIPEGLCYNKGFEKSVSERWNFEVPDAPALKNDFSNRISYSNIVVTDAFQNGARVFQGLNYRDYPKTYGSITRLIELKGKLLCVFEHGVALIDVNERALAAQSDVGNVYVKTNNVLSENMNVISDIYGSLWHDSIIKTKNYIYGVDTVAKKIWRTNGSSFECISDNRVQEFLNNNISLTERELTPIIGIRNVKTHYNKFKDDVLFTFYDNLYGFEERVWNLCFNETLDKWITFYSWLPSYSENIYNQYFSFDRNTSKWISKLGISNHNSDFADGITLENNIINPDGFVTTLYLDNRNIPEDAIITYTLERDNYGNYKNFKIEGNKLYFDGKYEDLKSEFYDREENGKINTDDCGRRIWLSNDEQINPNKVVILLNIKATIKIPENIKNPTLKELLAKSLDIDGGYYKSIVAVIPEYNMQFLTTDFWKHGLAGIIDIADDIYPTYWYGKQHPFEFEFVVAKEPNSHKIFDNLQLISNKAEPESFHYEIVGECYDFAKDKKNMYIRQEATKELYQYNGVDITFDKNYKNLYSIHRPIGINKFDKSTIFPLYYYRKDTINEIEDAYHAYQETNTKDFSALSGAEIVHYPTLNEYRIWNHVQGVNMDKGVLRGNMLYKEDLWYVQINPLNLVYKNETKQDWENKYRLNDSVTYNLVPAELNLFKDKSAIPTLRKELKLELPDDWTRNIVSWEDYESLNELVKMKDKFIKIRIRYKGNDLAIISAINTLYSISYG